MADYKDSNLYKKALAGDADAMSDVGMRFANGIRGFPHDDSQALFWFEKAAEKENAFAQDALGSMYILGRGVGQSYEKAAKLFQRAADQGNVAAQLQLGLMHKSGAGDIEKSDEKAVKLFQRAASQGNVSAQVQLGLMHQSGAGGVEKSDEKALKLYQQAANQGHVEAQLYLGFMYDRGRGVKQDSKKAFKLYQKAANQDDAEAQLYLGFMYDRGRGVKQDTKKAFKLYQKALKYYYTLYSDGFDEFFVPYLVLDSFLRENLPLDDFYEVIDLVDELNVKVLEILQTRHNVKNKLKAGKTLKVCHYTKYAHLKSMLQGKSESHLRMYNVRYCNDPTEGKYFFGEVNPNSSLDYFTQQRKSNIQLLENPLASTYILSLCDITNKDEEKQEIPNLWSVHGDGARGVCLTFEILKTSLNDTSTQEAHAATIAAANLKTKKTIDSSMTVYRILYKKSERNQTMADLEKELKAIADFIESNSQYKKVLVRLVLAVLGLLPYLYKDESYAYEDECRIIRNFVPDDRRLKTDDNDRLYWQTPLGLLQEVTIDGKRKNQSTIILGYGMGDNAGARDYIKNRLRHISKEDQLLPSVVFSRLRY